MWKRQLQILLVACITGLLQVHGGLMAGGPNRWLDLDPAAGVELVEIQARLGSVTVMGLLTE